MTLVDPLMWRMPVAFLCLGVITIVVSILACCGMATDYGFNSFIFFLLILLLIGLELGMGAYWVHIQPEYPPELTSFSTTPFEITNTTCEDVDCDTEDVDETLDTLPYTMNTLPYSMTTLDYSTSEITDITETLLSSIPPSPPTIPEFFTASPPNRISTHADIKSEPTPMVARIDFRAFERSEEWRSFQLTYKCCGINGAKDFIDKGEGVPPECCDRMMVNETELNVCELKKDAQKGCLEVLLVRLYADRLILSILAIVAGSVTLIMLVTSFFIRYDDDAEAMMMDDEFCEVEDFYPPPPAPCPTPCPSRRPSPCPTPCPTHVIVDECHRGPPSPPPCRPSMRPGPPNLCRAVKPGPPSPPCCRKYPPCKCAPKLRQC